VFAAFELGEFHRVFGSSSKNPHPEARLLPLIPEGFIQRVSSGQRHQNPPTFFTGILPVLL